MKISIITVALNDLERLRKTGESVLGQISTDFEWLIIDGCSVDGTKNYLKQISKDGRVRFKFQDPAGIYSAMNLGAAEARGEFLWFINAGDSFMSTQSVLKAVRELNGNKTELLFTPVLHVDSDFGLIDISIPQLELVDNYVIAHVNHQGVLVSSDLFRELIGFDESLRFAADGKFLDRASERAMPAISKCIYVAFEIGGTAARNFRSTLMEISLYRPGTVTGKSLHYLVLKNLIRIMIYRTRSIKVLKLIYWPIFRSKEKKAQRLLVQHDLIIS